MAGNACLTDPLLHCNGLLSLTQDPTAGSQGWGPASGFTRDNIVEFLTAVYQSPKKYGVNFTTNFKKEHLKKLCLAIVALSGPDGPDYLNPDVTPAQHIRRKIGDKGKAQVNALVLTALDFSWWSPHDLLGLFFSCFTAPPAAQWRNFYVPLLYVYGRWAATLGSDWKGQGAWDPPHMTQITWSMTTRKMFLGCTPGGLPSERAGMTEEDKKEVRDWRDRLGRQRFKLIQNFNLGKYNYDLMPNIRLNGEVGTKLGNCAETYPFATFLSDQDFNSRSQYMGIAFNKDGYRNDTYDDALLTKVCDPCDNCRYLLECQMGEEYNFMWAAYLKNHWIH